MEESDSRSLSVSVSLVSGTSSLLSSNQFPSMPQPIPRVIKIISEIHVRKRSSSHVNSFTALKIDIPHKKEPIDARGYIWGYF